jgi:glycosyltransferase involved in cell wall biosynthesis
MKKTIIVPVYNEEGNVGNLINKILKNISDNDQLIIVNDGSTDNTKKEVEKFNCELINHKKNLGKGMAMRTGISNATGDLIIFMGGDGQDDPFEIKNLIDGIQEGYDYVIGSRFIKCSNNVNLKRYSDKAILPINKIGNNILTFLINFFFGQSITDSQSEFKCFKSEKLKSLELTSDRYEIETELLIKSFRKKFKIKEVPVYRYERIHGKSYLFDVPFGRFIFGLKVLKTILTGYIFWR